MILNLVLSEMGKHLIENVCCLLALCVHIYLYKDHVYTRTINMLIVYLQIAVIFQIDDWKV